MIRHNTDSTVQKQPNRLINEKSPYLLQHAHNPVDWYAWGREAFQRANKEDKPIFLSIGYSTCHWCHVMEKESFEDPEVAGLMNETFVSIKVDREERPDLDQIYMTTCQMLTGSGGWPLTIMMTPDKRPFFAATYIPKENRFGRIGMLSLIPRIKGVWDAHREEIVESADKITESIRSIEKNIPGETLESNILHHVYTELAKRFDKEYGGFNTEPKFPTPHNVFFLLRFWYRTGDYNALRMAEKTLMKMRQGGIFDQIGFGFHRYSTDREWLVPHFEKMLYDQALLALVYMETYQATGKNIYGDTAEKIFAYVLRDMISPEGAFYSAEDADSEGVEGKFYLWTEEEIRNHLNPEDADLIVRVFNVERNGNYREESSGKTTGTNIFYLKASIQEIAAEDNILESELNDRIASIRHKLFNVRGKRIHPHKDDKILTDWNGLMIAAFARGAQIFGKKEYQTAAEDAARFIMTTLCDGKGRLMHRYRDGEAGITANADDYAFLIWGLIELYETTFDARYLRTALVLNQDMIDHFWDKGNGGFFFTPDDGEDLIIRKKDLSDSAVPSGNSVAMLNLLRLARFTANPDLEEMASGIEKVFSNLSKQLPSAYTHFMTAIDFGRGPSHKVIIVGNTNAPDTKEMLDALRSRFIPNKVTMLRATEGSPQGIENLVNFMKDYKGINDRATAYVCLDNTCKVPTTNINEMLELLRPTSSS